MLFANAQAFVGLYNVTVSGGAASFGGAFFVNEQATVSFTNVTAVNCAADLAHGGALWAGGNSIITVKGLNCISNVASLNGGCAALEEQAVLNSFNSSYSGNYANIGGSVL